MIGDLNGPRGLAMGPAGRLVWGENDGSFSERVAKGALAGTAVHLGTAPATYIAPAVSTSGGQLFLLTAGGPPGTGSNTLYRATNGIVRALADIAAYQQTDPDPYNLADDPAESNPFGVAALGDGSVLVSDAAANDLLRVYPNGRIETVARLKPRVVAVPDELPDADGEGNPLPPGGTMLPSEAVATSVTVGADGYYYVGELRGFPATPGNWSSCSQNLARVCWLLGLVAVCSVLTHEFVLFRPELPAPLLPPWAIVLAAGTILAFIISSIWFAVVASRRATKLRSWARTT